MKGGLTGGCNCGAVNESYKLELAAHFRVRSKQPWLQLPEEIAQMETQPEDAAGWTESLGGPI
ncbi:hypothetical protein [Pontixanthobacter luteolus]|uniref:hypothetical protein n=1 Tax=Pontixanthobacter luteolus TaxID=295089 RepID=UPI002304525E|nr:hypothetical protein [Pontixanthobacter luteolus]